MIRWECRRRGATLIELLLVLAIVTLLVSITMPAVLSAREASRRVQCQNRIRNLAMGFSLLESKFGVFPGNGGFRPGSEIQNDSGEFVKIYTDDLEAELFYQWGVANPDLDVRQQTAAWSYSILPEVEQPVPHDRLQIDAPLPLFRCPSRARSKSEKTQNDVHGRYGSAGLVWTKTDYCGNSTMTPNLPLTLRHADVLRGTSHTILLGEKAFDPLVQVATSWYWDEPLFTGGSKGTARSGLRILPDRPGIPFKENWGSAHPGGVQFAKVDGSVAFVNGSVDWEVLRDLLTVRDIPAPIDDIQEGSE